MEAIKIWGEEANVQKAKYIEDRATLELTFKSKKVYHYYEVPLEIWEKCLKSESGTKFLTENLKGVYEYKLIE